MLLDPLLAHRIIVLLWLVFIAYWVARAFGNKRTVYRQPRSQRLLYLIGTIAVGYFIVNSRRLSEQIIPSNGFTQIIGIAACAAGIALAIWARTILATNWSGLVTLKENHELIRRGPYRFVRHPIYSGIILALAGTFTVTMPTVGGLLFFLELAVGLRLKSLLEERILQQQFGEQYVQYKHQVKALVPCVY